MSTFAVHHHEEEVLESYTVYMCDTVLPKLKNINDMLVSHRFPYFRSIVSETASAVFQSLRVQVYQSFKSS